MNVETSKLIPTVLAIDAFINNGGGVSISQEDRRYEEVIISMGPREARLLARRLVELAREIERSHV